MSFGVQYTNGICRCLIAEQSHSSKSLIFMLFISKNVWGVWGNSNRTQCWHMAHILAPISQSKFRSKHSQHEQVVPHSNCYLCRTCFKSQIHLQVQQFRLRNRNKIKDKEMGFTSRSARFKQRVSNSGSRFVIRINIARWRKHFDAHLRSISPHSFMSRKWEVFVLRAEILPLRKAKSMTDGAVDAKLVPQKTNARSKPRQLAYSVSQLLLSSMCTSSSCCDSSHTHHHCTRDFLEWWCLHQRQSQNKRHSRRAL